MKKKILVTGGDGRFAKILKKNNKKLDLFFASKKQCNILNLKSISKIIKKIKPKILIHCAGLSRPMNIHDKNISKSIDLNIIGTANITKICKKGFSVIVILSIKELLYIATEHSPPSFERPYLLNGFTGSFSE